MVLLDELAHELVEGHADAVARLTRQALDERIPPAEILEKGLIAGMEVVGARFRDNVYFVPEVLLAARAMKAGMAHLEPVLAASGVTPRGKLLIGTVKGDIHDIGKNLVGMMLRGAGFEVIDLGINVPAEQFVVAIRKHDPELVGMSALLTTTMVQMKTNLEAFRAAGVLGRARVLVGGAAVSEDFARTIGADGYAKDATSAVERARELLEEVKAMREAGEGLSRPYGT